MTNKSWNIYRKEELPGGTIYEKIDTVFFDSSCDVDYVRNSLINHDGCPHDIIVEEGDD